MDGHSMKRCSTLCYALMGLFYMIQVSILGYTVYFLSENGYVASEIGILLAISGIIAAAIQPMLGHLADNNEKIDFKTILTYMGMMVVVLFIILYRFYSNKVVTALLFCIIYVLTNSMSPFVNESSFYYSNRGFDVDYGKVRGFGSFSFAVLTYILGALSKKYGAIIVVINGIVFSILFCIALFCLPRIRKTVKNDLKLEEKSKSQNDNKSGILWVFKYPSFILMMLAMISAMYFQNANCGYLIDIINSMGGNSYHLGIAGAIAAIVEIPTMFFITKLMKKINVKTLIVIACAFYILRGFLFRISSLGAIYVAQAMQMLTYAIIIPASVYLSDEVMEEKDKNKGQTLIGMSITVGMILGSFVGGQMISIGGPELLEISSIFIAFFGFAFAMLGNILKN